MALDHVRRADHRHALDHVRIQRALRQEVERSELRGFRLEHVDERRADDLALLLRIGDAGQPIEKQLRGVGEHERQLQPLEPRLDLRRFVLAHHAVVDEDARQAIADRAVNDHRRDRGIDAAAQSADHPAVADLCPNPRRRLLHERRHRPVARAAADVEGEVAEDVEAVIGVRDFGMEQQRVEPPIGRRHRRDRRVRARRGDGESGGAALHEVAVARPHAQARRHRSEQRRVRRDARSSPGRIRGAAPAPLLRRARASSAACRSRCRAPARRRRTRRTRNAARPPPRRSSDRRTG